jgi:glutamate/tyrosine decarboxylase-like PLP-dependent enzyme
MSARDESDLPELPAGLDVPADLLDIDPEQLRALGYWVVDRTIEHLATLNERPAITTGQWDPLASVLGGPVPQSPATVEEGLRLLAEVALENQQHGDHPRYFARVPAPSSYPAILGEWLATGMQGVSSSWGGGSGTATIELVVLDWLRDALGLPATSEGVLLSGGSMANITALIVARTEVGEGVVYLTDQTHSSIRRGLLAMGQAPEQIRVLPTGEDLTMSPAVLREAIATDLAAGLSPRVVIATAGTTNTGAVDDLPALASICREIGAWLHADGAYGGPAALAPDRSGIRGLELVDSFVMDPHKWLFQPYDIACLWVAKPGALYRAFAMHPEYLADVQGSGVDFGNRSLELSRRTRAAKLWLTVRTYGIPALVAAIRRGIALAEYAQQVIEADPRLEIVTPAQLGIVTFAGVGCGADDHWRASAEVTADGYAAATCTVLHERTVLRLCTINPRTTTEDIRGTVAALADALVHD